MHKRINELTGRKTKYTTGCLKSKEGKMLMGKEDIVDRWTEYIGELYGGERPELTPDTESCDGPPILED